MLHTRARRAPRSRYRIPRTLRLPNLKIFRRGARAAYGRRPTGVEAYGQVPTLRSHL